MFPFVEPEVDALYILKWMPGASNVYWALFGSLYFKMMHKLERIGGSQSRHCPPKMTLAYVHKAHRLVMFVSLDALFAPISHAN